MERAPRERQVTQIILVQPRGLLAVHTVISVLTEISEGTIFKSRRIRCYCGVRIAENGLAMGGPFVARTVERFIMNFAGALMGSAVFTVVTEILGTGDFLPLHG